MAQFVFPKVDIEKPKYSKRDLSKFVVGTINCGPLYPVLSLDVLPGDKFSVSANASVQSMPMIAPVIGRWKLSLDYYFEPWSNLYGFMDNNTRQSVQSIVNMRRHTFTLGRDKDYVFTSPEEYMNQIKEGSTCGRGSLLEWLGVPAHYKGEFETSGIGSSAYSSSKKTEHPLEKVLSYFDIVRNYYVNNQFDSFFYVAPRSRGSVTLDKTITAFSIAALDNAFRSLRFSKDPIALTTFQQGATEYFSPEFRSLIEDSQYDSCGLACRTYRMDLLRGILNSTVGSYASSVDTSSGSFTVETLYFANKLQNLINKIDLSGGRFSDWIRTRWSTPIPKGVDRPVYLGSQTTWIDTTNVVATASGDSQDDEVSPTARKSVLGQQAGFVLGGLKSKRNVHFVSQEYGTFMCIASLVPDVVYSQGFELDMLKTKFSDIYDPAFKQLGYQPVSRFEYSVEPLIRTVTGSGNTVTNIYVDNLKMSQSVGKRIAWSEYMASLPRAYGHFSYGGSLDYWVNNRDFIAYAELQGRPEFTTNTYINPTQFNNLFADQSLESENFRLVINFDISAVRPIGKRLMPHL